MLPTCRQVAEQLSDHLDQPATGFKWLKLQFHLLMCKYCRIYGKQIELSTKTINLAEPKVVPSNSFKNVMVQHYKDCHCQKNKGKKVSE